MLKLPYREAVGVLIWTVTMTRPVRGTRFGQVLEPWTGALLKDGDLGHTLPASHERVRDHVRWVGL